MLNFFFTHPGPEMTGIKWWLLGIAVMLVASIIFRILVRRKKLDPVVEKFARGWVKKLFWFALAGAALIFLRTENATFWSARIFFALWWVIFIFEIARSGRKFHCERNVSIVRTQTSSARSTEQKWIPRGKKRGR